MRYISTRDITKSLDFIEIVKTGLAPDGGLYVPESWPVFDPSTQKLLCKEKSYQKLASFILYPFVQDHFTKAEFAMLINDAYKVFHHPLITPLKQLDDRLWIMELFHGPSLAFKDIAMQFLARILNWILHQKKQRLMIVCATSGDTGASAIEAFKGQSHIDVVVLYPSGRISDMQRRQMTTVHSDNIEVIALDGTFDECQHLVKRILLDQHLRSSLNLCAVNSINWARLMAQIVYYFMASFVLSDDETVPLNFVVPTGNFGNIYAGYAAWKMGLPVEQLIVATNNNDILTRFFNSGMMAIHKVEPTLSPSMDIQQASNFERLLFDLCHHQTNVVDSLMKQFQDKGVFEFPINRDEKAFHLFKAYKTGDQQTLVTMKNIYQKTGYILDPHTAVGVSAALQNQKLSSSPNTVVLSTAHPAKFPDAVYQALHRYPDVPPYLTELKDKQERQKEMPNNLSLFINFIKNWYQERSSGKTHVTN
ncbi:MAG: threonine synthase [Alphaproteobacteria bacterium]|nr:threonine synthase [Alphaproteobacteria bacterium]